MAEHKLCNCDSDRRDRCALRKFLTYEKLSRNKKNRCATKFAAVEYCPLNEAQLLPGC